MFKIIIKFWLFGIFLTIFGLYFLPWSLILIWAGVSWLLVGLAYFSLGAKVFGKNPDGNMSIWSRLVLLPYLLGNGLIWHLQRVIFREDCYNEIIPRLIVGRRSFAQELPDDLSVIIDLTAEFVEPKDVMDGKIYICVPTLDASVPKDQDIINLVKTICYYHDRQKTIYIHCALGHGRAAAVAAGVLLSKGLVTDVDDALKFLKEKRSSVKLNSVQIEGLERLNIGKQINV